MINMVKLQPKTGGMEPAEIQVKTLFKILNEKGMPLSSQLVLDRMLRKGSVVDGNTLYKEFENLLFIPFLLTKEEAKARSITIL